MTLRTLLYLLFAGAPALWMPVAAQVTTLSPASENATAIATTAPRGGWMSGGRSYLGLQLGRPRQEIACAGTALVCSDRDRPAQLYAGTMVGKFWGVEMGYLNLGVIPRTGGERRAEGLNFSLVGRAQLAPSVGVFGKVGSTYSRTDSPALGTNVMGAGPEHGFGLSFGGGLSFDFTPRLSATVEWESSDFRFAGPGRDNVRSTSLGLKYRY